MQRQAPGFDEVFLVRENETVDAERATIFDAGIERRLGEDWRASATVFHRAESDRLRLVDGEFRLVNGSVMLPATAYVDNVLEGSARGIELTVERRTLNGLTG